MKFFYNLERKYRKYAIPNLMFYIIGLYGIGLVLSMFVPQFYLLYVEYLSLDAEKILHGQIWRIITFMVFPPGGGNPFFSLISMYLYYMIGTTLERIWGSFRFNVYFFMGILGHVLAALILNLVFKIPSRYTMFTTEYLNYSLFFAFAATFPDMEFMLFFVIPIKAKWLAIFNGIYFLYSFIQPGVANKITIILSLLNFILFFFMTRNYNRFSPKEMKRKHDFKKQIKIIPQGGTHHKCAVCGRTEKDSPDLEFRYCSKCAGSYEYCSEHLYTHKHITREDEAARNTTNN